MKKAGEPNKHKLQSAETRRALLEAAEKIFARDGFERAQLEEIAHECGRTRGAVYAQYATKEHLFFALQELRVERARRDVGELIAAIGKKDAQARRAAFRKYYAEATGPELSILDLELRLYALRHPESLATWRERYAGLYDPARFKEAFGVKQVPGRSRVKSRVLALNVVKSGMELAMKFQPDELTRKEMHLLLFEIFDGLFPEEGSVTTPARKAEKGRRRTA